MRGAARWAWWGGLLLLVALAPVPLGGVNTWWIAPLAALALVLGLTGVVRGSSLANDSPRIPLALVPLGVFSFLILVTLFRLPEGLVAFLSPGRAGVPPLPEAASGMTLSSYPGGTLEQGILHLGVFYLVWATAMASPRGALRVLAAAGAAHAVLGVVLAEGGFTTSRTVLGVYPLPDVLTPFGTWVNKNHFAGFLLVGAGANLALLLSRWRAAAARASDLNLWSRVAAATGPGFFWILLPGLGFLTCVLSVFASGSRGAALALAGALLLVTLLAGLARRRLRWWPVLLTVFVLAGAALAARLGNSESVLERLVPSGRYLNRPRLWRDTLRMAVDHPVLGTGLGSFPYVFPRYQTFDSERQFTHAEGDWIQYLAETGLAGSLLLLVFAGVLFRTIWRALRTNDANRSLAFGAGVALAGVVLHGLLDSSLHIPANLIAAGVLAGAVLALGVRSTAGDSPA